jgi:hypothetical protein
VFVLLVFALAASAREIGGVEFAEQVTLAGAPLALNGVGLRERYFLDIYVAALYLPAVTHDPRKAIDDDVPKRIVMHFVYRKVTRDQAVDALRWRLEESPSASTIRSQVETFVGWLEDFARGDEIVFDYVPGTGTTVTVKGRVRGTFVGQGFMQAIWSIFLGESPITPQLRDGLLGL